MITKSAHGQADSSRSQKIPAVEIRDMQGKIVNTSTFSNNGKPMLIVFWNSFHRFPSKELDALQEKYVEWKKETGVKIIVVSVDDSRTSARVSPMINAKGWDFEFYFDSNADFKRAMNVNLLPHTFLATGTGHIVWQKVGFIEGDEEIIYAELLKIKPKEIQK